MHSIQYHSSPHTPPPACGIRFCMECEVEETHHNECTRCLSGSLLYHEEGECLAGLRGEVLEVAMEQEEEVEEEERAIENTRLARECTCMRLDLVAKPRLFQNNSSFPPLPFFSNSSFSTFLLCFVVSGHFSAYCVCPGDRVLPPDVLRCPQALSPHWDKGREKTQKKASVRPLNCLSLSFSLSLSTPIYMYVHTLLASQLPSCLQLLSSLLLHLP